MGEQGSNVFYLGNGNVISIYGGDVSSIEEYQNGMLAWNTVKDWNRWKRPEDKPAESSDFPICWVRRPIPFSAR